MDEVAKELQAQGFKGFLSVAQLRRCDSLVASGEIAKEVFNRDLLATDIESIPWRKGAAKEEDGTEEFQNEFRASMLERRQEIALAIAAGIATTEAEAKPQDEQVQQEASIQEGQA